MQFYSTRRESEEVLIDQAVMRGLPPDNGLYMPEKIQRLPDSFFENISEMPFEEMAYQVAQCLLQDAVPADALKEIVYDAINFKAPVVELEEGLGVLELFHGPSLAFKDFGARFMARLMSYFIRHSNEKLTILVATSGDTGGAVAQGFYKTAGIEVVILYPSQKISVLQEKQLTTLGENITALEVKGNFDDCQALVKQAFLDEDLRAQLNISSANSINIARLIPQAFYYFRAYAQLKDKSKPLAVCVPSGNFGNLTAGLIAQRMGLPIAHFVAANNANDVFKNYLDTGVFTPRPSVPTHSNAMDVGNPSNLQRIQDLYNQDVAKIGSAIAAYSYTNEETVVGIQELYERFQYVACPHTAVAYLGMRDFLATHTDMQGIFLATAHAAKFLDIVEDALGQKVALPDALQQLVDKTKEAILMDTDYDGFRAYLLGRA